MIIDYAATQARQTHTVYGPAWAFYLNRGVIRPKVDLHAAPRDFTLKARERDFGLHAAPRDFSLKAKAP